jgi:hypothetical protein
MPVSISPFTRTPARAIQPLSALGCTTAPRIVELPRSSVLVDQLQLRLDGPAAAAQREGLAHFDGPQQAVALAGRAGLSIRLHGVAMAARLHHGIGVEAAVAGVGAIDAHVLAAQVVATVRRLFTPLAKPFTVASPSSWPT